MLGLPPSVRINFAAEPHAQGVDGLRALVEGLPHATKAPGSLAVDPVVESRTVPCVQRTVEWLAERLVTTQELSRKGGHAGRSGRIAR